MYPVLPLTGQDERTVLSSSHLRFELNDLLIFDSISTIVFEVDLFSSGKISNKRFETLGQERKTCVDFQVNLLILLGRLGFPILIAKDSRTDAWFKIFPTKILLFNQIDTIL